jgi:cysteine desulfurase
MGSEAIYLDHNATTPLLPEVAHAMREAALAFPANPASQHRPGQYARRALEECRERIAALLGAKTSGMDADRLVFTSGGTEANNLAILGMLADQPPGHLITSAIEHPSLLGPVGELERRGWAITRIAADVSGVVRLEELATAPADQRDCPALRGSWRTIPHRWGAMGRQAQHAISRLAALSAEQCSP